MLSLSYIIILKYSVLTSMEIIMLLLTILSSIVDALAVYYHPKESDRTYGWLLMSASLGCILLCFMSLFTFVFFFRINGSNILNDEKMAFGILFFILMMFLTGITIFSLALKNLNKEDQMHDGVVGLAWGIGSLYTIMLIIWILIIWFLLF